MYADGFVIPILKKNIAAYRRMANLGRRVWMDHGAVEYFECVGDDLEVQGGVINFLGLTQAKEDETVIFAWILYKSRAHRDAVNKKVMADKRMTGFEHTSMPFEMQRMTYGGFKGIVEARPAQSTKTKRAPAKRKAAKAKSAKRKAPPAKRTRAKTRKAKRA
jgi:uncharacterized protein YbaA (DUF1428 family)